MLPPEFSVSVGRSGATVRLAVAGELDLATAPLLADHLAAVGAPGADVVLDLAGLTFLDSSGVTLLLGAARRAARDGWALRVAGLPEHARRVLELCGVLDAVAGATT
jgi:anti-anti-sigma factor